MMAWAQAHQAQHQAQAHQAQSLGKCLKIFKKLVIVKIL